MNLVSSFQDLVQEFSPVMTAPTFQSLLVVLTGWLFARRRTVTAMIQAAGAVGRKHHSAFHRLFASARRSLDEMGLALFGVILRLLMAPEATIFLAVDDTLARKRGLKVFGVGMHHDPLLSSRRTKLVNWGHSWVLLGVLAQLPFLKDRWFCLPILFRLYRSRQTVAGIASARSWRSRCSRGSVPGIPSGGFTCWPTRPTAARAWSGTCPAPVT